MSVIVLYLLAFTNILCLTSKHRNNNILWGTITLLCTNFVKYINPHNPTRDYLILPTTTILPQVYHE